MYEKVDEFRELMTELGYVTKQFPESELIAGLRCYLEVLDFKAFVNI